MIADPDFVPEILLKGVTQNSFTIGWSNPPEELRDHVYYMLIAQNNSTTQEAIQPGGGMNLYLFQELQSATTYHFKVHNLLEKEDTEVWISWK